MRARRHRPEARNPFLAGRTKKVEQLTCEDCGLDVEQPLDRPTDPGRDSGRAPWSSRP
jgi:hypothetical protein